MKTCQQINELWSYKLSIYSNALEFPKIKGLKLNTVLLNSKNITRLKI